ncbi:MAG: HAMP domain-containing sensor histidine kinase [Bacteriovoracales bacterium]|nr:HAMP domain-containing sensor histidine kinase [Bacteriovoracales bacterium]
MKKIPNCLDLSSLLILSVYAYIFFPLMGFSLVDMALLIGVDTLALVIIGLPLIRYGFLAIFPQYQNVFPSFDQNSLALLEQKDQMKTLERLYKLPSVRATFVMYVSIIKVIPTGIVWVYFVDHGFSIFSAWVYFISFEIFFISLFSGLFFIELHIYIVRIIREIRQKYHLSTVFNIGDLKKSSKSALINEHSFFFICFMTFAIQAWLLFLMEGTLKFEKIIWIVATGLLVLRRVYVLYRKHFLVGVEDIRNGQYGLWERKGRRASFGGFFVMLSRFQCVLDDLFSKLKRYEERVLHWLIEETEQSRFRALGEISAAVGHDLKGPIHAINFSLDELREHRINDPKILKHLGYIKDNMKRIEALSGGLNANLRNPDKGKKAFRLTQVHREVLGIFKNEFTHIENVEFTFLGFQSSFLLKVQKRDLIHILYNLYKNSFKNFKESQIDHPKITFTFIKQEEGFAWLQFSDNGTGISEEEFKKYTHLNFDSINPGTFKKGLGLRLVKKIMENNGGLLKYGQSQNGRGTSFLLNFPSESLSPNHLRDRNVLEADGSFRLGP